MPFNIGPGELIFLVIVALLIFGPKKLPELGKALGESIGAFKKALSGDDTRSQPAVSAPAAPAIPESAAAPAPPSENSVSQPEEETAQQP